MNLIKINHRNSSIEIIAKLMNSFASKYNCSVKYDREFNRINFFGDDAHKLSIANELVYLFEGK
ncbi:MAG: hypothetical protein V1793_24405 [Pseudomonadota bacterium]